MRQRKLKPTPAEVFDKLIEMTMTHTPEKKPGAMLRYLSKEQREALKKLKSKTVANRRVDGLL